MTTMRSADSNMVRVVSKSTVQTQSDDLNYWRTIPIAQRVAVVEVLRQRMFGENNGTRQGLHRVCRIIHHS
jgi:hypothetical protein